VVLNNNGTATRLWFLATPFPLQWFSDIGIPPVGNTDRIQRAMWEKPADAGSISERGKAAAARVQSQDHAADDGGQGPQGKRYEVIYSLLFAFVWLIVRATMLRMMVDRGLKEVVWSYIFTFVWLIVKGY